MMRKVTVFPAGSWLISSIGVRLACLLILLAVFLVVPALAEGEKSAEAEWEQYKSKDDIFGYKRNVEGSKYLETRAETVADVPIAVLLEVLVDIPSYPQWMHACKESVLLQQEGELKRELYFAQGVPLGSPDRDAVIRATTTIDWDKTQVITTLENVAGHPYQHPVDENARKRQTMQKFKGVWDLEMLDPDRTKVLYTAYTEPGGFAPKFVVNNVIRKVSFESVKGLISMAKNIKYCPGSKKADTIGEINTTWKQYKNKDGITGYERNVEGSMFLETRAETVIDAPLDVLREVLKDFGSYSQWMHDCREAFLLKQEQLMKREIYFVQGVPLDSPGQVDLDRDTVIKATTVEDWDNNRVVTTLQSIDDHPYQRSKAEYTGRRQRMNKFKGVWELEMLDSNRTKTTFTTFTDPAGLAPMYVVNKVIRNVSFESVKGLMKMAKNEKYIDAAKKNSEIKQRADAAVNQEN